MNKKKVLRIAIDIRPLAGEPTGIGRFTENLIHSLALADKENQYLLYGLFFKKFHSARLRAERFTNNNFSFMGRRIPATFFKYFSELPWRWISASSGEPDVVFVPDCLIPPGLKSKVVSVVHDVIPFFHPEWYPSGMAARIKHDLKNAFRKSDMIITVSESSRRDILELGYLPESRVKKIPVCVAPSTCKKKERKGSEILSSRHSIKRKFILFVGTIEPRKNIKGLLTAYRRLKEKFGIEHQLIIAGKRGWMYEEIIREIRKDSENVVLTGYVPEAQLWELYRQAEVFVYPSFYEGYGMPVLEAMASGTPVITSNISSLPEIAGEAAILIDPSDTEELTEAMRKVIFEDSVRQSLIKRASEHVRKFSPYAMGEEVKTILEEM